MHIRNVTPVPLAPKVVRGISSMQGAMLPVLDLAVCFQPAGEDVAVVASYRGAKDKLLLVETVAEPGRESVRAALTVERVLGVGVIDEQFSRPPPARPAFLSATVLDSTGPALLFDIERTLDYVRDAIGAVIES
jgi:chemotaxis signal transduction protein